MKNKSGNHKSTNRFKFVTFTDRVNSIDIRKSALYRIEHVNADKPEENETHFHNTIIRWKVLNLTTEYISFTKNVENIVTLPQLLLKKDEIVSLLLENLEKENILTLQPLLELVIALAKDLQDDFYSYFPKIFDCLVKLLNTKDPEQLEWTLICIAFLFKALKSYLKRDFTVVFKSILPLLSDSTKWYIRNFATESFAFIARDVKDKKKFIEKLVKIVHSDENAVIGCGHLFFEILRGVGNQFHSCAATFLELYLEAFKDPSIDGKTMFTIMTQTIGDMLDLIDSKNGDLYWNKLLEGTTSLFNTKKEDGKVIWTLNYDEQILEYMLLLIGQSLEYSQGKFLTNPLAILNLSHNLINAELSEKLCEVISNIGILVLLCRHINLPHENAVSFVKRLLSIPYPKIVSAFVQEVVSCTSFDMIVFPHFVEYITEFNSDIIKALSRICVKKSPLCKNGSDVYSWVKYPIDLGFKCNGCYDFLKTAISRDVKEFLVHPDDCINSMICLPHIKHVDVTEVKAMLKHLISNLINELKQLDSVEENVSAIRNIMFCLALSVESAIHIIKPESVDEVCLTTELLNVLLPYINDHRFICSLRILDLIFTIQESEHLLREEILEIIHPKLEENLLSPIHEVRLLSVHIYSLFETILNDSLQNMFRKDKNNKSGKIESFKVFSLCYSVEKLPLSVESFREQILKLSKMGHNTVQYQIIENTRYKYFPLKYMLGFLSANFKLLWEPVQNLILTFANGLQVNEFWEIFHPCLQTSIENVRNSIQIIDGNEGFSSESKFLHTVFTEYYGIEDKPDSVLYRLHLIEILHQASNVCNVKNKDITILFLDFMKVEFNKPQLVNIYETSMNVDDETAPEEQDENDDEDDGTERSTVNRATYDALIAFLKVYTNAQNPKSFYKEQTLHAIYYDFLMHKNPVIQKVALDCLLKYKNKHILPYKERLYNLVDGKKFKEELRTFKLESENECLHVDDRDEVMPVILRIAFSKMITNIGVDKKGGSQMRKSLVMRFLAGCTEDELVIFMDMAFNILADYINLDTEDMCKKMEETYSSLTTLAPKRLMGCLNLLESMREQFIKPGESKMLSKLLKVIFCIGSFVKNVLKEQDKLKPGYVGILKTIRNHCLQSIANFFKQLDEWTWSEKDILFMYDIFIWPAVEKLPIEGIHSPTAILKLFSIWSQIPRYHVILNVFNSDTSTTVIPFILKLLSNIKIHQSVNDICMSMLEKLFTMEHVEDDVIQLSDDVTFKVDEEIVSKLALNENLNVGSRILLPHISTIVTILKNKLGAINPRKLSKRDLTILSRTTELVYDPDCVDILLQFSLPILIHKISSVDIEENLETSIEALTKLLSKTPSPKKHILNIIPLFSKVSTARARKLLCESLKYLAKCCHGETAEILSTTADVVIEMNASDEKWLEQPDFERRLAVYKRIHQMLNSDSINVELASLIVHNCFFTIGNSNDISLRSSAVDCLRKIVPKLLLKYKDVDFFVQDTVLLLIKNGLKSDNDILRLETTGFLGELVRECPDVVTVFSDLHPLTNKSNSEVDFFENLQHLQIHRKIRAFNKFCIYVKTLKKAPSPRTLMHFIFPLASQYICNEKYFDKHHVVEAAIETVGVICRLLPWRHYEIILKLYLTKLHRSTDHQKQLIKLISGILDAFHYDLSRAGSIEQISSEVILNTDEKEKEDNAMEVDEVKMDEDVDMKEVENEEIVAYERVQTLSPSGAKRVIHTITNDILMKLNWSSSQVADHELAHKSLKKTGAVQREAEEKLRIPMGFAIVILLQKLPQPMLDNNILSILIKIINFLKSPLINVRLMARDIISKIMVAIGSKYLSMLLTHMNTLLTRGIHVHILISTVHTVLEALEDKFQPGDMDSYFDDILKICLNDLFGHAAEEKEVTKLANKAPETKPSKKCFLTLRIIAQNITSKCIVNLLAPFKNVLETTISKRTVLKVESCFQHISAGLTNNNNISIESLLIFICGVLSESIPKLSAKKKVALEPMYLEEKRPKKSDCLLITPDPKGSKSMPKKQQARASLQANTYVIIELGLNLTFVVLQKDKINTMDCRPYLDPMVPFILDALKSPNVSTNILALKVINSIWVKRINLPTLKKHVEDCLAHIFGILHKYATSGLSKKDENFHLVSNSFKAMNSFIRNVQYHTLTVEQTKALLMYAEHDIHNFEKQATAFMLLKAILSAKYDLPEIKDVIKKVMNVAVTDESPRAREESSQVLMTYLMNYSNTKVVKNFVEFFVKQMEYEVLDGRMSAIKILQSMLDIFPLDTLALHASFVYISLGMRLISESSLECKELMVSCIDKLIQRLPSNKQNEIFNLTLVLFNDNKSIHIEIAARLLSRYIIVEGADFKNRIETVLPKINEKLSGDSDVGRFVRLKKIAEDDSSAESKDCKYIEILKLLDRLCTAFPIVFTDKSYQSYIEDIGSSCQELLAYSHALVRLGSVDFLTSYFKSIDISKFVEEVQGKIEASGHFCHSVDSLKSLSLDLCSQLLPGSVPKELASSTCKSLSALLKAVSCIPFKRDSSDETSDDFINCVWITKKIKSAVNAEVAKTPSSFIIRFAVFEMMEELSNLLDTTHLLSITTVLMSCLLREMSRTDSNFDDIKNKAVEVGSVLNNKLGSMDYNDIISRAQMKLAHKRKERKLKIAQDKVQNPERAAKRKLALKDKKREYKKRKVDKMKGRVPRRNVSSVSISMEN